MSVLVKSSVTLRFAQALKSHAPAFSILGLLTGCVSPNNTANLMLTPQQPNYIASIQSSPIGPVRLASAETPALDATTISLNGKIYNVACAPEGTRVVATDRTLISHGSKVGDPAICLSERADDGERVETLLGIFTIKTGSKPEGEEALRSVISQEVPKITFSLNIPAGTSDQNSENIEFCAVKTVSGQSIQALEIHRNTFNVRNRQSDGRLVENDKTGDETIYLPVVNGTIYADPIKRITNRNPGGWKPLTPIAFFLPLPTTPPAIRTASR